MSVCAAVTYHYSNGTQVAVDCWEQATRATVGLDNIKRLFCDFHADLTIEAGAVEGAWDRGD